MEKNVKKLFLLSSFSRQQILEGVLLLLGAILGIYFDWNIIEILIFLVFLWSIFRTIPSRYLAGVALCFLILVPIFLSLDRDERAEEFSIYAYYFFVMAVIRGIIEIRSEKNDEKNTEKS